MKSQLLARTAAVAALGLTLVTGATINATHANAVTKDTTKISCKAVKVHKQPKKTSTVVGIAYKGDKMLYDQWAYKKSEKQWYTRGKITRKSDGAKIYGYVIWNCANPYGTNPAPTPKP
ncbi:hypothetical protein ACWGKQ_14010 [Streptomyces sp. NPDC054770]